MLENGRFTDARRDRGWRLGGTHDQLGLFDVRDAPIFKCVRSVFAQRFGTWNWYAVGSAESGGNLPGCIGGLTVACARCHDHKFDPITQMDYYRMMAIFFPFVDYDHPLAPASEVAAYAARKSQIDAKIQALTREVRRIEDPYIEDAFQKRLETFPDDVREAVRTPEEKRSPGQKLLATQMLSIRSTGARQITLSAADRDARNKLQSEIATLRAQLPKPLPVAAGIRDGDYRFTPDGPGDEPVAGTTANRIKVDFEGSFVPVPGRPYNPPPTFFPAMAEPGKGKLVEAGFLSVLTGGAPAVIEALPDRQSSGRRRALAEWIASPGNPLTARVMVNRIWH